MNRTARVGVFKSVKCNKAVAVTKIQSEEKNIAANDSAIVR
jgi:hypothetical protein